MNRCDQRKRRGDDRTGLPSRRDFLQTAAAAAAFVGRCGGAPGEEAPEGELDVR
jgi:hypothetical protein